MQTNKNIVTVDFRSEDVTYISNIELNDPQYSKWIVKRLYLTKNEAVQGILENRWTKEEKLSISLMVLLDTRIIALLLKTFWVLGKHNKTPSIYELSEITRIPYSYLLPRLRFLESLQVIELKSRAAGKKKSLYCVPKFIIEPQSAYEQRKKLDRWVEYRKDVEKDVIKDKEAEDWFESKFVTDEKLNSKKINVVKKKKAKSKVRSHKNGKLHSKN